MKNNVTRRLRLVIPGLAALLLAMLTALAAGESMGAYDASIRGVDDKNIREALEAASNTLTYKDKPPATPALLEHRARTDIPGMLQALRSLGYYDPKIEMTFNEGGGAPSVIFHISTGPLYRLESIRIERIDPASSIPSVELPSPEDLGLALKEGARAGSIVDARKKLVEKMKERGFPFARVENEQVIVDHDTKLVSVVFPVNTGPMARFGPTSFSGLQSVEERFVQGLLPWKPGDRYDSRLESKLQERLIATRLFSLVQVERAPNLNSAGELPILVELKERTQRSVSVGATYHTDEGPGGKVSWENRNLLHGGETLKIDVGASAMGYSGEGLFKKPGFLRNDQTLLLGTRLANDDTNAFVSRNLTTTLTVERQIRKGMTFSVGPEFRVSEQKLEADPLGREEGYAVASLRSQFNWDTTDNLLDPTRGGRLRVQLVPAVDTLDTQTAFFKGLTTYSHYVKISDKPYLLFAGQATLGTILGVERDDIPPDMRFYAGGGGSVRGYAFQLAGPMVGEYPIGGRSLMALSLELRTKVTEKVGLVAFVDGGSAFEQCYPDLDVPIRWGGGLGARYYTPLGPLRLDVAVPINRRSGIDDPFQIYVSIGQAF